MRIVLIGIILTCSSASAAELTKAEIAARDLTFAKISLGTTLEEFQRKYPQAHRVEVDNSGVVIDYVILLDDDQVVHVAFFGGKIHRMTRVFSPEALAEIGGGEVLARKIMKTFGSPNLSRDTGCLWKFTRVQRNVKFLTVDNNCALTVYDSTVGNQVEEAKANKVGLTF